MELELVTNRPVFPEGPISLSDGSVLVVEIRPTGWAELRPDGTLER